MEIICEGDYRLNQSITGNQSVAGMALYLLVSFNKVSRNYSLFKY